MNTYTIYTKWLAYELRKTGFNLIETGINHNFPEYNTYIFEDTPEFRKAFQEIIDRGRR